MDSPLDRNRRVRDPSTRMHGILRVAWITAAMVVAVAFAGVGLDSVTTSPRLCAACHEIRPQVDTWRTSAHSQIGCPSCHETPLPWYRFPEILAIRGSMLARDLAAHLSYWGDSTARLSRDATMTIPDSNCLRCHGPAREVTTLKGTFIDHTEHAERNESCISCHLWTTHRDPDAYGPLLLMAQCFTCHGRSSTAEAPGTCDVCHPESFELRPESHKPSIWQAGHGKVTETDRQQCLMCHEESACRDCHGLDMPHPPRWVGDTSVHGAVSREIRQVCEKCHGQSPDFCTVCHHEGYLASRGSWVAQHPSMAERQGVTSCMHCHAPTFCVDCHTGLAS